MDAAAAFLRRQHKGQTRHAVLTLLCHDRITHHSGAQYSTMLRRVRNCLANVPQQKDTPIGEPYGHESKSVVHLKRRNHAVCMHTRPSCPIRCTHSMHEARMPHQYWRPYLGTPLKAPDAQLRRQRVVVLSDSHNGT